MRQRYVDAVCREIRERMSGDISTIYIGGGTPSQLSIAQLQQIAAMLPKAEEFTIEVNPDDVTEEFAAALPAMGINRVSMGAQSFCNKRLKTIGRRHTAEQVAKAVEILRKTGIDNISIDLMYGFPGENISEWQYDIDEALRLKPNHLSAYCLMIEEGTVMYEQMKKGEERSEKGEELEREMYYMLIDRLKAAGYEHYELSNFALPGYRSRHNSSYWNDTPYIGIGAAAHGYDGKHRRWNVSNLEEYINGIENDTPVFEQETLDDNTRYNDRITVALRTREGLDIGTLQPHYRDYLQRNAQKYITDGLLTVEDNHLRLSRRGLFVSDMIMADLMSV